MTPAPRAPLIDGLSMPPRYAPHERTYISWPPEVGYRWSLKEARNEHAFLAKAIAPYEKVIWLKGGGWWRTRTPTGIPTMSCNLSLPG